MLTRWCFSSRWPKYFQQNHNFGATNIICFYVCLIGYVRTRPEGAQNNANLHLKSICLLKWDFSKKLSETTVFLSYNWTAWDLSLLIPRQFSLALLNFFSSWFTGTSSLKLNTIDVPAHRVVGDKATLVCQFDMEGDTLYSVKWYKDDREFYRYVPNDRPRLQVFDTKGIHVDVSKDKWRGREF